MARKPVATEEDISFPEPETATGYPQMGNEVQEEEAPEDWQSAIIAKPDDGRTKALAMVAAQFGTFRPARSVLTSVRAVPTIFPQFDFGTRVRGCPLERFIVVHGPSSHGKAHPVTEPVLTPYGFVEIGSLSVGDCVIGSDGKATRVVGVYPQGFKDVYEVTCDDGGKTKVCAEHLWSTKTSADRAHKYARGPRPERIKILVGEHPWVVRSTAEIANTISKKHSIPIVKPVNFVCNGSVSERDSLIDPYVMGLLLGDGSFRGSTTTFSKNDDCLHEIIKLWCLKVGDSFRKITPESRVKTSFIGSAKGKGHKSVTAKILESMGLRGKLSHEKFIPPEYLISSIEDRLAILRGLMDTDGSISNEGMNAQYTSTSKALIDGVVFIVRSLGGRAYTYARDMKENSPAWSVLISFNDNTCPFSLARKAAGWKTREKAKHRLITNVEHIGSEECVCIKVAAENSLYVANDFMVTHNTQFVIGAGLSFIRRGHFFNLIDAEMTTPAGWVESLFSSFGVSVDTPLFNALRPKTYEETVSSVRQTLKAIIKAKKEKKIPQETSCLFVVDSIRKLVPENILAKVTAGKNGVDGMGGRSAQIKAAMNAAWLDELIPSLYEAGCTMIVIARESENTNTGFFDGPSWKMTGGKALEFDSSLILRISREGYVKQGSGDSAVVIGERHQIAIRKTKVAGKEDKQAVCYFHTSNGRVSPEGFDPNRDTLDLAIQFGIVKKTSSWLLYDNKRIQGETGFVLALNANPDFAKKLETEVRAAFDAQEPLMIADTVSEESLTCEPSETLDFKRGSVSLE